MSGIRRYIKDRLKSVPLVAKLEKRYQAVRRAEQLLVEAAQIRNDQDRLKDELAKAMDDLVKVRDEQVKAKDELTSLLANFEKSVPVALRACARNAAGGEEAACRARGALARRMEYVRAELLLACGGPSALARAQLAVAPRILAQEKLAVMSADRSIRCALRCQAEAPADVLNIWTWAAPGVDIVAEPGNLPFTPGELAEIRIDHMDEIYPWDFARTLLPYWRELLGPEGLLRCTVSDGAKARALLTEAGYAVVAASAADTGAGEAPLHEFIAARGQLS